MALTFLEMTNAALRRLNEVQLTSANFATAKGFHAQAKDAVNSALVDIHRSELEWPFNHVSTVQTLTAGQNIYALPADARTVDWESFYLKANSSLEVNWTKLPYMDYDQYLQRFKAADEASQSEPIRVPQFIYRTQNEEFGVSPYPDEAYEIGFEYWGWSDELVDHDDTTTIPTQFKDVIVNGAMYYCYLFRENIESADRADKKFKDGIKNMRTLLINRYDYMRDTRTGGVVGRSGW